MDGTELFIQPFYKDSRLVGYWRCEGNSIDIRNALNGTDTAITYGTSYGIFGQGMLLNGTSSVVNLVQIPLTRWTWSVWAKPNGLQTEAAAIISDRYTTKVQYAMRFTTNTLSLIAGSYDGAWHDTPGYTLTDGVWQHIVFTYDGATLKLYVGGLLKTQTAWIGTPQTDGTGIRFGQRWDLANHFKGNMDDISVFNAALTDTEILTLFFNPSVNYLRNRQQRRLDMSPISL